LKPRKNTGVDKAASTPAKAVRVYFTRLKKLPIAVLERLDCPPVGSPISTQEEMTMDWNRIEGNWKQFKGAAKEKWGKLTDDDLNVIEGRREQLEGKLQQRYGFAKDQIHKDVDDWFRTLR
jgi:uncharacterized protein YjbJ (UPF0337 family)